MLRFTQGGDLLEVTLISQETAELPSRGDAYLAIRVESEGFSGDNGTWVARDALHAFCRSLVELERTRQGEATLAGMSPDRLHLKVRSVDSSGHMAVEGSAGRHVRREHSLLWHAAHFGFEFEAGQLAEAVRVEWVRMNAAGDPKE